MVVLIKFIDKYLGSIICNVLGLFKWDKIKEIKADKILVVQLWGIGETILMLPSLDALRKKFPNAQIDVLATIRNRDVFFNNENLNSVHLTKLNPFSILLFILKNLKKYDLVIDMEEYLNISAILSFFAGKNIVGYSHGARAELYDYKVKYNDRQHAVETFLDLVREAGIKYDVEKLPNLNFSKSDKNKVDRFLKGNDVKNNDFLVCVAPGRSEERR